MTQIDRGGRSSGDWDTPVMAVVDDIKRSLESGGARRPADAGTMTPPEKDGQ